MRQVVALLKVQGICKTYNLCEKKYSKYDSEKVDIRKLHVLKGTPIHLQNNGKLLRVSAI